MGDCGGYCESLADQCDYDLQKTFIYKSKRKYRVRVLAPENISYWVSDMALATLLESGYKGNAEIEFIFLISELKGKPRDNGTMGFRVHGAKQIIIAMPKVFYGNLKRTKPEKADSSTLQNLIHVLWHEVHHLRREAGTPWPTGIEYERTLRTFWDLMSLRKK